MNKIKSLYEVPTINIFEVRLEESVLTGSPQFGITGYAGGYTDDENYGEF